MKSITVVIPNLNGMKYLEGCLSSLESQSEKDFETILIDNGSTDGSVEWVRAHYPKVRIRAFHRNTGFCRAVNEGIRLSRTPYVLLLNNDVSCGRDMVRELGQAIRSDEKIFSCCAKLVQMQDPSRLDDAGDFYSALGWAFARGKGQDERRYDRPGRVFACCAAAAVYRKDVLEKIGLFDERHFAYLEDIDIGYRALIHGYENRYVPSAVVLHAGSGTSGSRHNAFKVRLASRNGLWLIRKNMPLWQILLNLPLLAAGIGIKLVYFARIGLGRDYLKGLVEGFRALGRFDRAPAGHTGSYLKIQLALWSGCLMRVREAISARSV